MNVSPLSDQADERTPISYRAFEASRNDHWNNYKYERANPSHEIATRSYTAAKPPIKDDQRFSVGHREKDYSEIVETVSPVLTIYSASLIVDGRKFFHMIVRGEGASVNDTYQASVVVDTEDMSLIEMIHDEIVADFKKRGDVQCTCKWFLNESHFSLNKGENGQRLLNLEQEYLPDPTF